MFQPRHVASGGNRFRGRAADHGKERTSTRVGSGFRGVSQRGVRVRVKEEVLFVFGTESSKPGIGRDRVASPPTKERYEGSTRVEKGVGLAGVDRGSDHAGICEVKRREHRRAALARRGRVIDGHRSLRTQTSPPRPLKLVTREGEASDGTTPPRSGRRRIAGGAHFATPYLLSQSLIDPPSGLAYTARITYSI